MKSAKNIIKIIIAGLDFAGKTSILTALDKKFDFRDNILELKPTIRVNYKNTKFLNYNVIFWDLGGQAKFRELYLSKEETYFGDTDLLLYVIDIQDDSRFDASLEYLNLIMAFFLKLDSRIPVVVTFHKLDPEIRSNERIEHDIQMLSTDISKKYPDFEFLFQETSIFDILSIIQLVSYSCSVFNRLFFELSELLEKELDELGCSSLILFDRNGIIISEFYSQNLDSNYYIDLLENIKEHLFLLKRMEEEKVDIDYNFLNIEFNLLSYLHRIDVNSHTFFLSVIIEDKQRNEVFIKFPEFSDKVEQILRELLQ